MRLRADLKFGTITDNPLAIGATTINSAQFATLPTVGGSDELYLTLDPEGSNREIVRVTAHAAAATVVTVQRGQLGTAAAQHALTTRWVHNLTTTDLVVPCTDTTRPTLGLWAGMEIWEENTDRKYLWNGTAWVPVPVGRRVNAGTNTASTDAGGNIVIAHGLGAVPTSVVAVLRADNTALINQVAVLTRGGMDATNFTITVVRSDTGAVLASSQVKFDWQAMT